ncbi:MAG: hypothetical protein WC975_03425 [Phycisphaerae bacterium]
MDPSTTQAVVSGLSDLLFFQRPQVMYGVPVVIMIVGIVFWILGHQIHQLFLTVVLLGAGVYAGWRGGTSYELDGINLIGAMTAGGLLGAGIGYWLFRFWLGLLASGLITLILLSLYTGYIALPYLNAAKESAQKELIQNGVELAPGTDSQSRGDIHLPNQPMPTQSVGKSSIGQAYQNLQVHVPMLSRAKYPDARSWQTNFPKEAQIVWDDLIVIMPRLTIDLLITASVSLIIGFVLVVVAPIFLDIAYTSLLGLLLVAGGVAFLVALKDIERLAWIKENFWVAVGSPAVLWAIGLGIQYKMIPPTPPPAEEPEGEGENPEKPPGGKKKK